MTSSEQKRTLLKRIPPITELLKNPRVIEWLTTHPASVVTESLREATDRLRQQVLSAANEGIAPEEISVDAVLARADELLQQSTKPRLREAINATGIILHTGLGRAVFPGSVVDSIIPELKGYCTLATDPESGERIERDELVEPLLTELTGAEAATIVNNNAAGTMLVLAALAAQREVIVSRGQLIEIGGSFRLPEVMAQSQAKLVEVGATNRTHLRDYVNAVTPDTGAIMRVHPSNYRVVGFTSEPALADLAQVAHQRGLICVDDLGAGALLDLEQFGFPHEPTVRESINAGADVVLFSGDKLIGGSQAGVIVGRKDLIQRLRKHPLMRAMRVDKTCVMVLERTLQLFRDPERLRREHPVYVMLCAPLETLRRRAQALTAALAKAVPNLATSIDESVAYLGSGSLPNQAIPSLMLTVSLPGITASELGRRLRLDAACVFGRIENDRVRLDMRTITDEQVPAIAAAFDRINSR